MTEEEEKESSDVSRINIRLTPGQYDLMRRLGGALGFDRDSTTAKHFLVVGMQASMSSLATAQTTQMTSGFEDFMNMLHKEQAKAEQMDLVKEAEKAGQKNAA